MIKQVLLLSPVLFFSLWGGFARAIELDEPNLVYFEDFNDGIADGWIENHNARILSVVNADGSYPFTGGDGELRRGPDRDDPVRIRAAAVLDDGLGTYNFGDGTYQFDVRFAPGSNPLSPRAAFYILGSNPGPSSGDAFGTTTDQRMHNSLALFFGTAGGYHLKLAYYGSPHDSYETDIAYNYDFIEAAPAADSPYRYRLRIVVSNNANTVSVYAAKGEGSQEWFTLPGLRDVDISATPLAGTTGYIAVASHDGAEKYFDNIAYTTTIMQNPDRYTLWGRASTALSNIEQGDDANALAVIDGLLADFNDQPDLPRAISNIEEAYYMRILSTESPAREDYLQPVVIWEKAAAKVPGLFHPDADLYYFLGDCYRQLGDYEKAIQYYNLVADRWTQKGYAVLTQVSVPKIEPAADDYGAVHTLIDGLIADFNDQPGLGAVILRLGQEYYGRAHWYDKQTLNAQAGDYYFKAVALWDRVISELPGSAFAATACYLSAISYRQLGEYQEAINCCEKLLAGWPDYEYASNAQDLINYSYRKLIANAAK